MGPRPPAARSTARSARGARSRDFAAGAEAVRALVAVRPVPDELPADRPARGRDDRRRRRLARAARARLRVGRARRRAVDDAGARVLRRSRRDLGAARSATAVASAVGSWREAFLRAPYLRDTFVAMGVLSETFETAITWERFPAFHAAVLERARARGARGVRRRLGDLPLHPRLSRRARPLLHDPRAGAPRRRARAVGARSSAAASDAVIAGGGTITHHHAVGARSPAVVRPPASRAVRRGAARRQGGASTRRGAQPGRADRPVSDEFGITAAGPELYDRIGRTYTGTRRPDPRIAAAIWDALGDARTVLNVGAGAGRMSRRTARWWHSSPRR